MRKGFAEAPENMIEWVGLILICIIMLYVIVSWAGAGAQVQTSLEQGSLIWSIASATNALSVMEEGEVVRNLRSYFDIEVTCSHACEVATAAYDRSNNRMPKSDEVLILGKIRPVVMEMVNKISLTKEPQQEVVLSGEQVENLFGTELQIREESPMCFSQTAKFKDLIQQASSKYGIEK